MKRIIITIILLSIIMTIYPCTKKYTGNTIIIIDAYNNLGTDYVTRKHIIIKEDDVIRTKGNGIYINGIYYETYTVTEKQGVTIVCCEKCNCFDPRR